MDPSDYSYARAGRRGTWSKGKLCPECTASSERRIQPLIIEWLPDSDVVGGFVWPGLGDEAAITQHVMDALQARFKGFEPGPIKMTEDWKLKLKRRRKPQVRLPYRGPPLVELWVTHWAWADHERSSITFERKCSTCGLERYDVTGVERWEGSWDPIRGELSYVQFPRRPDEGIFVSRTELGAADIFHLHEFPAAIFCTDRVKTFIEQQGFTNVGFWEYGDVI